MRAERLDVVITDRDIRDQVPSRRRTLGLYEIGNELEDIAVEEVMSRHPAVVAPEQALATAAAPMLEHKVGCLAVFSHERVSGLLTSSVGGGANAPHTFTLAPACARDR